LSRLILISLTQHTTERDSQAKGQAAWAIASHPIDDEFIIIGIFILLIDWSFYSLYFNFLREVQQMIMRGSCRLLAV